MYTIAAASNQATRITATSFIDLLFFISESICIAKHFTMIIITRTCDYDHLYMHVINETSRI